MTPVRPSHEHTAAGKQLHTPLSQRKEIWESSSVVKKKSCSLRDHKHSPSATPTVKQTDSKDHMLGVDVGLTVVAATQLFAGCLA